MYYTDTSTLIVTGLAVASFTTVNALWVPDNRKRAQDSTSTKAESTSKIETTPSTTTAKAIAKTSAEENPTTKATLKIQATSSSTLRSSSITLLPSLQPSSTIGSSSSNSGSSSSTTGGIVGGIVAAVAVVALVGAAAFLVVRKKRSSKTTRAARLSSKPDPFTNGFGNDDCKFPPQQQQSSTCDNYKVAAIPPTNNTAIQQPIPHNNTPSLRTFTVIATFITTLSDELEIEIGDQIQLIVDYDDGWCQGVNVSNGNVKGVFPRHCIDYATAPSNHAPNPDFEKSKRVSSMYQIK